jgi:hypothetical protein
LFHACISSRFKRSKVQGRIRTVTSTFREFSKCRNDLWSAKFATRGEGAMDVARDRWTGSGIMIDSAEKPLGMLRRAQHERKILNVIDSSPFVLRLSKDERRIFQQNRMLCLTPVPFCELRSAASPRDAQCLLARVARGERSVRRFCPGVSL